MKPNLPYACRLLFVLMLFAFAAPGREYTPMDAFIARERLQHSFRPVPGLWSVNHSISQASVDRYVTKAQFFTLDKAGLAAFMEQKNKGIRLVLPDGAGGQYEIDLARFDFLARGFTLEENAGGLTRTVDYEPGLYYRGIVSNVPGSLAAFSFFEGKVYGIFSLPGIGNFSLVPNTVIAEGAEKTQYILYNDNDVLNWPATRGCQSLPSVKSLAGGGQTAARLTYNNCKDIEVYLKADYATYLSRNSSTTDVADYLTSIFNVLCVLYRNEGIYTSIRTISVNTASDDYQSLPGNSLSFLNKFGELTQNNLNGADLAHLVSTRYNAALGGIAWLGVLCVGYSPFTDGQGNIYYAGPYAFSNIEGNETAGTFPTYSWNVECMTHEMGHNLGSNHTHDCVWNGNNTAIDGCGPTSGNPSNPGGCATGPIPSSTVKGTIMSYCHLLSGVGISFANGFGPQPGDTIRYFVNSAACATNYIPDTVLSAANTTLQATRECTDATGLTFYWNDNNNASEADDRLVLKLKKGTNNIGTLDSPGFAVSTTTLANYGSNTGTPVTFPAGTPNTGASNAAMNRYWNVTPVTQPVLPVEVQFPFAQQDISDVAGSIPSVSSFSDLRFYKMASGVNPDPAAGFTGATASNTTVYTYNATTPSIANWTYSTSGNTRFARFLVTSFSGGGGFGTGTAPLPMELIWFRGVASGQSISLDWEVTNEKALKEYIVAKSADGIHYEDMSIVSSRNLASGRYNTLDYKPLQGNNYYSLSLVNKDGSRQIVSYTQVAMRQASAVSIYPNPARDIMYIDFSGAYSGAAQVRILDMGGRVVYTAALNQAHNTVYLKGYTAGIYLVQVIGASEIVNQRIWVR